MVDKNTEHTSHGQSKITVYLSPKLIRRLKLAALNSGTSVSSVVVDAVENYLKAKTKVKIVDTDVKQSYDSVMSNPASQPGNEIPEEYLKWVSLLLYILKEKNEVAVAALQSNLHAFGRLTHVDGGKNAPPPNEPIEDQIAKAIDDMYGATEAIEESIRDSRRGRQRRDKTA